MRASIGTAQVTRSRAGQAVTNTYAVNVSRHGLGGLAGNPPVRGLTGTSRRSVTPTARGTAIGGSLFVPQASSIGAGSPTLESHYAEEEAS